MQKVNVPVVNTSKGRCSLPKYETEGSAGMDVKANIESTLIVNSGDSVIIPTGLKVAIPEGYEIQIRPRSGLAAKMVITVLNSPGTIDSDFRNEIGVILINHGKTSFRVEPGDRIAQIVLKRVEIINWEEVLSLDKTGRDGGFGSTGGIKNDK